MVLSFKDMIHALPGKGQIYFIGGALQIILELCIPEKELAKTRSQI
jgi:hypothetical protein